MASTTLNPPRSAPATSDTPEPLVATAAVGMGQIYLLSPEGTGNTVLGSCVGVVLFEPNRRIAAMAHIVLPASEGRPGTPGKFVDTAIAAMVAKLRTHSIEPRHVVAKMAGGANMFASKGPFQIGKQNAEAVHECLAALRIRLVAEHVGGSKGRRVTFDCRTGQMLMEVLGETPVVL